MAGTADPLFGHLRGRIGNVVIYRMNGKTVIRSRPSVKRKPATGKLRESQEAFAAVITKMSAVRPLVNFGFEYAAVNRSAFHFAVSVNLNRYRSVPDKDQRHWLLLSHGTRSQVTDWTCNLADNNLELTWGMEQGSGAANKADRLVVYLVQKQKQESLLLPFIALRGDRQALVTIPRIFCKNGCDCFASFYTREIAPKKHPSVISDSIWVGGW